MKKVLILFILFAFYCFSPFLARGEDNKYLVDRVLAVVNNEVITQSEFDAVFRPIYDQIMQNYHGSDQRKQLEEIRIHLLNQMIEDRLVAMEAKKLGIEVSDADVQAEVDAFKKQFPDEKTFEAQMKRDGLTLAGIEKRFRERLAIEKLHEAVIRGQVAVTPTEVEEYYKTNAKEFVTKPKVEAWVITVRKSDGAIQQGIADERAKSKIEKVWKDLKKGKDFSELARKNSDDDKADQGGFMGVVAKGDLLGEFDAVIFSLNENTFSDVIETEMAYHILKAGKKYESKNQSFEEVKDQIYEKLFREKSHAKFVEWMADLKKKSLISIR